MSTQPPSQNSPADPTSTQMTDDEITAAAMLKTLHEALKQAGVDPTALACVAVGDVEMFIGEVYDHQDYVDGDSHASIFQHADFVSLKNPKRLSRLQMQNRQTGQVGVQLQFGDFDFMTGGIIEVRPTMAFFFDWCDFATQYRYCNAYLGFIEGKKRAAAQAAGLILPSAPPATPGPIRG